MPPTPDPGPPWDEWAAAIEENKLDVVKKLIPEVQAEWEDGVNRAGPAEAPCEGGRGLHLAVAALWTTMSKVLLAAGADVNARDAEGRTPLMRACMYAEGPRKHLVDALMGHPGFDVYATCSLGRTALHYAALMGHKGAVIDILEYVGRTRGPAGRRAAAERQKAFMKARDRAGDAPLQLAVRGGSGRVAGELLCRGAAGNNLEWVSNNAGYTVYHEMENLEAGVKKEVASWLSHLAWVIDPATRKESLPWKEEPLPAPEADKTGMTDLPPVAGSILGKGLLLTRFTDEVDAEAYLKSIELEAYVSACEAWGETTEGNREPVKKIIREFLQTDHVVPPPTHRVRLHEIGEDMTIVAQLPKETLLPGAPQFNPDGSVVGYAVGESLKLFDVATVTAKPEPPVDEVAQIIAAAKEKGPLQLPEDPESEEEEEGNAEGNAEGNEEAPAVAPEEDGEVAASTQPEEDAGPSLEEIVLGGYVLPEFEKPEEPVEEVEPEPVGVLSGHSGVVTCWAWAPDGKRLASCSTSGEIKVWAGSKDAKNDDAWTFECSATYMFRSEDGVAVVEADEDAAQEEAKEEAETAETAEAEVSEGGAEQDAEAEAETTEVEEVSAVEPITGICWTDDGGRLAVCSGTVLEEWDVAKGERLGSMSLLVAEDVEEGSTGNIPPTPPTGGPTSAARDAADAPPPADEESPGALEVSPAFIAYCKGGRVLASASGSRVSLWHTATGTEPHARIVTSFNTDLSLSRISALCWSADALKLTAAGLDGDGHKVLVQWNMTPAVQATTPVDPKQKPPPVKKGEEPPPPPMTLEGLASHTFSYVVVANEDPPSEKELAKAAAKEAMKRAAAEQRLACSYPGITADIKAMKKLRAAPKPVERVLNLVQRFLDGMFAELTWAAATKAMTTPAKFIARLAALDPSTLSPLAVQVVAKELRTDAEIAPSVLAEKNGTKVAAGLCYWCAAVVDGFYASDVKLYSPKRALACQPRQLAAFAGQLTAQVDVEVEDPAEKDSCGLYQTSTNSHLVSLSASGQARLFHGVTHDVIFDTAVDLVEEPEEPADPTSIKPKPDIPPHLGCVALVMIAGGIVPNFPPPWGLDRSKPETWPSKPKPKEKKTKAKK